MGGAFGSGCVVPWAIVRPRWLLSTPLHGVQYVIAFGAIFTGATLLAVDKQRGMPLWPAAVGGGWCCVHEGCGAGFGGMQWVPS